MEKIIIDKLDSNAIGVGRFKGRPNLCAGVLPDEEIEILERESYAKYDKVTSFRLLSISKNRIDAPCKYYKECGGCSLQHANYGFQKEFKIKRVKDFLKHIANIEAEDVEYYESLKQFAYRNKIVFAVQDYCCGMYKKDSNDFIPVERCLLIDDEMNEIYSTISMWIKNEKINLNHIAIRKIEKSFSITLIGEKEPKIHKLIEILKSKVDKFQIVFNCNNAKKDLITEDIKVLYGENPIYINNNLKFSVSANSFLQVNNNVCEKLYQNVASLVEDDEVINAYSGAGLLTAILSKKAKNVFGVEIVKNAHKNAENLMRSNSITNAKNYCGKSEDIVPQILNNVTNATLVMDPPRKGVNKKLSTLINENKKINKVVYVSCDPNTLARDLRLFSNYKVVKVQVYNMFPQTHHVEILVYLEKLKVKEL